MCDTEKREKRKDRINFYSHRYVVLLVNSLQLAVIFIFTYFVVVLVGVVFVVVVVFLHSMIKLAALFETVTAVLYMIVRTSILNNNNYELLFFIA